MEPGMAELTQKIDQLAAQVAYLTEQAQIAERQRAERAELLDDLMPAMNGAYSMAVEQFSELEAYFNPADLLRLLKRIVRDGPIFERLLEQMESFSELAGTLMPLSGPAFEQATTALEELDRRGYFVFARGGMKLMDNIVTSFTEDDVRQLGENVVLILNTVKQLTQPEIMNLMHNLLLAMEVEKDQPVETSLWALWRQMQDPNVRRGLALTMRALRAMGGPASRQPANGNGR